LASLAVLPASIGSVAAKPIEIITRNLISMAHWNNKIVVVTGGSDGLGKAIGFEFAAQGAQTILLARSEEKLIAAVESARSTGVARGNAVDYVVADVTVDWEVESAVAQTFGLTMSVNQRGFVLKIAGLRGINRCSKLTFILPSGVHWRC